jgi:hypothetical protein
MISALTTLHLWEAQDASNEDEHHCTTQVGYLYDIIAQGVNVDEEHTRRGGREHETRDKVLQGRDSKLFELFELIGNQQKPMNTKNSLKP